MLATIVKAVRLAATNGHVGAVSMLHELHPEDEKLYHTAAFAAALAGKTPVLRQVYAWDGHGWSLDLLNDLFEMTTVYGHTQAAKLIKSWRANGFDNLLCRAAESCQFGVMKLAVGWGATDFDTALCWAAAGTRYGSVGRQIQINMMVAMKRLGAKKFKEAQQFVSRFGERVTGMAFDLLEKWIKESQTSASS